ncbi:MAG: asparagine synthase (glutamine-hydrolyzing) [Elusimicrobia bacterium]|nr:asparagine synthase (glutamine-hydrolyzing) [Elusimicrobiota bacterium]
MCGICGFVKNEASAPLDGALLKRMNDLIVHRGPDDEGQYMDARAALAMRRLSIIDLSTGHQPICNEDGSVWVTLNGEIYNFLELRPQLEAKGHRFKTKTDTEVIVHLYEEMGDDCVKKLRGMFAFALWDKKKEKLLLARDRIGKKPLIYTEQPDGLAWASELRCLLEYPGVRKEIDPVAVDLYLSLQYIPAPRTIFKGIRKLPPAHILVMEKGRARISRYWNLPLNGQTSAPPPSLEAAKHAIREKLKESVRIRMIADVPLGAFLSGGIDSSVVVALMSELSPLPVKTFSIGFAESEFSELHYARELARRYGCDHREFIVESRMTDVLPKIAWHYSEPYADASALPSYYVAKETRRHVTVALNGDGGDENFAGYLRYMAMNAALAWDKMPLALRKLIMSGASFLPEKNAPVSFAWRLKRFLKSVAFSDYPDRHLRMTGYFSEDDKDILYSENMRRRLAQDRGQALAFLTDAYGQCAGEDFINRLLYVDFVTYLPECLMVKMDIASMANSLETRSPLLDHEFVELVYGLPGRWKLRGINQMKWIFKQAFKDYLPKKIYGRGKMGFGIPLSPWFRGELKGYLKEHLFSPEALKRGYFTRPGLERLIDEHERGARDHGYRLWALLMLELWHQVYKIN